MKVGEFELVEPVPELSEPHVFTMIRPWIDVGNVASIALNRLERHFDAKEFGRLARPGKFFDFTRYRPTIGLVEGRRELTIPNSIINYAQPQGLPTLVFCHLLEPHAFGEDYTDSVLQVFKHMGMRRYCRIGAMYDAVPHTRPVLITGDTGGVPIMGDDVRFRKRRSTYQGPTTILNLVSEGGPKLDLEVDTMNFMVHLPHYLQLEEDYAGAAGLLEALASVYDIPHGLVSASRGQRNYRELDKALEGNPDLKSLIERLETQYDAEEDESQNEEESAQPPSLSPEVEKFLEEMDQRFGDSDPSEPGPATS